MKLFFRKYGFILFGVITLADLIGILLNSHTIVLIAKPLLLPALLLTAVSGTTNFPNKWLILVGLAFSFAGDVFLLFDSQNPLFFIFGLVAFLITHVLYIFFFLKIESGESSLLKQKPYLFILVVAYVAALLLLLFPYLGALKLPVVVYAIVLGSMLTSSLHVYHKAGKTSGFFFVTGASFFVLSDSLLAINKFYMPFPLAGITIMATYCAAQYFIVRGLLTNAER